MCTINGRYRFCEGGSTDLCVPSGAASYSWNTGASTNCIIVDQPGLYSVTITDVNGCSSTCSQMVTENPEPMCTITGDDIECEGQSTELCGLEGNYTYLWSTGEITRCIEVFMEGTYTLTVTDDNGCSSSCSHEVIVNPDPIPEIMCPADVTIECDESSLPSNTGTATSMDTCNQTPVISYADVVSEGDCLQESTITRTWTASLGTGNTSSCVQVITVEDNTFTGLLPVHQM